MNGESQKVEIRKEPKTLYSMTPTIGPDSAVTAQ